MANWNNWIKQLLGTNANRRRIRKQAPRRQLVVEGLEERLALFTSCGGVWSQPANLTFSYGNLFNGGVAGVNNFTMLQAVEEALSLWARYVPFTFREVSSGSITLGHGDLSGSTLGQATCPTGGDVTFDSSSRNWSTALFLEVAVHEIGHALGMGHSTLVSSPVDHAGGTNQPIMNPSIQGVYNGLGDAFLYQDDVNGIRARYSTGVGEVITTRNWAATSDGNWDTDASWGPVVAGTNFEPTINADVTIQSGRTVTINSGTRRARTVTLANADGNTGVLIVSGGTLTVRRNLRVGVAGSGTLNLNSGTVTTAGLDFGGNAAADQELVNLSGAALNLTAGVTDGTGTSTLQITAGTLDMNNNPLTVDRFLFSGGNLIDMNGTITIRSLLQLGTVTLSIPNLTLQGDLVRDATVMGSTTVSSSINLGGALRTFTIPDTNLGGIDLFFNGNLSNGGLAKIGAGSMRLQGNNTYTGPTNLNQGELVVNGTIATSSLTTVAGGATLKGTGTVGATTVNGIVAPGESAGTLTVNGAYTQNAGGRLDIELGGTTAGTGYDVLQVNGSATIAGQLNVSLINGFLLTPGTTFDVVRANTLNISGLTLTGPSAGSLTMSVVNVGGQQVLRLTVGGMQPLRVTGITPNRSGFFVQFNRAFDPNVLNLYDAAGSGLGAADITLIGTSTGPVRGSVVINAAMDGFHFVRTGAALAADTYQVTLRSAANGFRDLSGGLLDGDGDGTAGGDFSNSFAVTPAPVLVSVPDFMRGPGQSVDVPATSMGLPLRLSNGSGVTTVSLTLRYNTALLEITGASTAIPGASVSLDTATAGQAVLTFTASAPLASGPINFITLTAAVPDNAPYASKQLLDVTNVVINSGAVAGQDDDGIHVAGYFGDATGNAAYSSADAARMMRVAVGLDSGFAVYQLADPVIIADITGNGILNSTDATRVLQAALGMDPPEVPPLPGILPPIVPGGPDPLLRFGNGLKGKAGNTVTVPLELDLSEGLESADLAIAFDASRLEVVEVRRGTLTADFELFSVNVDPDAGTIQVGLARLAGPLSGEGAGSVIEIVFRVRENAEPGLAVINLRERLGPTLTQLNEGGLDLIPDPRDEAGDPLDGSIVVPGPIRSDRGRKQERRPTDTAAAPTPEQIDATFFQPVRKQRKDRWGGQLPMCGCPLCTAAIGSSD